MTDDDRIKLEPSWKAALRAEFEQPYMHQLREFLRAEHAAGKQIYPPGPMIFNALNSFCSSLLSTACARALT